MFQLCLSSHEQCIIKIMAIHSGYDPLISNEPHRSQLDRLVLLPETPYVNLCFQLHYLWTRTTVARRQMRATSRTESNRLPTIVHSACENRAYLFPVYHRVTPKAIFKFSKSVGTLIPYIFILY
jgi:hypothetical protein